MKAPIENIFECFYATHIFGLLKNGQTSYWTVQKNCNSVIVIFCASWVLWLNVSCIRLLMQKYWVKVPTIALKN